jgi:acyl carrier protein
MTKKEFLNLLEEIAEAEEGTLTGNESLSDLEIWDSLGIVTFIARIDEELDVTLSPEKISQAESIQDLINLLEGKIES